MGGSVPSISEGDQRVSLTRLEAESLLFRECRLLDERRLHEWLGMFAKECLYWVPGLREQPGVEASLIHDDRERLEQRVFRLMETTAHAQLPPSETHHHVSNVEVMEGGVDGGDVLITANLLIFELRRGDASQIGLGEQRVLSARCTYNFAASEDDGWKISEKKTVLLTRGLPQYNLSFLL